MFEYIKKAIHDITTEPDNDVVCPVRLAAIGTFVYSIGMHAYTVIWQHALFDFQNFAIAFSAMITTLGAALKMKSDSRPNTPSGA